jgi:hypothetical protein
MATNRGVHRLGRQPDEFFFGCNGLSPPKPPRGHPGHVTQAVARLDTQAAADMKTFRDWLYAAQEGVRA